LSCQVPELSIGDHLITATVLDPFGGIDTQKINLTIINEPPAVKINYPTNGALFYTNQTINFRGYAFDEETYGNIPVTWSSNISEKIGEGENLWIPLPEGEHEIILTAVDERGLSATDTITIRVEDSSGGNGYPDVKITQPVNGTTFPKETLITFKGEASDPEDGEISNNESYSWYSDIEGFLGTGKQLSRKLSMIVGSENTTHTILLKVIDSDGNKGVHSIKVTILQPL
jgi:hypothetical protein